LRHYRQQKSECALVAACMAYNKRYPYQSRKFERVYGKTWIEALTKSRTSWQCIAFTRELIGVEPRWFDVASIRWKKAGCIVRPPLGGDGIITIDTPGKLRHAVAFSNGMIYDGNAPCPLPWDFWASHYPSAFLDGWHPVREK